MFHKRFRPGPWLCTLAVTVAVVVLPLAPPWLVQRDEHSVKVTTALLDRRLPELKLENARLEDAVTFLHDVTGLTLRVDWDHLAEHNVHRGTPVTCVLRDIPVRKALTLIIDSTQFRGVAWEVDGRGRVLVAARQVVTEKRYECRDLLIDSPQPFVGSPENLRERVELIGEVEKLITMVIDPSSWQSSGGPHGTIRYDNGVFVIRQTQENHRLLRGLMMKLRETRANSMWFLEAHWYQATP